MKKNNKGFIAISLVYSFFLAILIALMVIVSSYVHNRILLNDVKKETQEYLKSFAKKFAPVSSVNIGDYISYTPSSTSYTILTSDTGYTSNQTISPSELNLWRVIRKNDDGTIDVVSEYASSTDVYFKGKTGYEKFIGTLNTIARQYEIPGITVESRHMGYDSEKASETVTVSDATKAPWTTATASPTSSSSSISPAITKGDARESAGGGDYGYLTDYELVNTAIGTTVAYKPNTTTAVNYWLASRMYSYSSPSRWNYNGRDVVSSGSLDNGFLHIYWDGWEEKWNGIAVRPIVTLDSTLNVVKETQGSKEVWKVS